MNFLAFLRDHWLHVAPILLAAAFAIAIVIERYHTLFKAYPMKDPQGFFDEIGRQVVAGRMDEALAHCEKQGQKPVAVVVKQALLRARQPEALIEQVPPGNLTHVLYAFLRLCGPGQLPKDAAACQGHGDFELAVSPLEARFDRVFARYKQRAPHLQVLASVGVARPIIIVPSTRKIRIAEGMMPQRHFFQSAQPTSVRSAFGIAGTHSGLMMLIAKV